MYLYIFLNIIFPTSISTNEEVGSRTHPMLAGHYKVLCSIYVLCTTFCILYAKVQWSFILTILWHLPKFSESVHKPGGFVHLPGCTCTGLCTVKDKIQSLLVHGHQLVLISDKQMSFIPLFIRNKKHTDYTLKKSCRTLVMSPLCSSQASDILVHFLGVGILSLTVYSSECSCIDLVVCLTYIYILIAL